MLWIILSLLTAFCESLKDLFSKKSLAYTDVYLVAFGMRLFALPFLLPLLFFIDIPELNKTFYVAVFTGGTLNILITVLFMKAIKDGDLSATVPLVTFTPLFLLLTSPLLIGEFPNIFGFTGVVLIVFGAYFMHIKQRKKGILMPFRKLLSQKGPRLMLLVAFLWSITANIDKIGITNSSPLFYVVAISIFLAVGMAPVAFLLARKNIGQIRTNAASLSLVGFFSAATLIFQMVAISLTLVAYVIAIKRFSAAISVLWGHFVFKEKDVKTRFAGTIIMILGVLLITLFT